MDFVTAYGVLGGDHEYGVERSCANSCTTAARVCACSVFEGEFDERGRIFRVL